MQTWGITAKLLFVPIASAALLVTALAVTTYSQHRYDAEGRDSVTRHLTDARRYATDLDTALDLHARYVALATIRLSPATPADGAQLLALREATHRFARDLGTLYPTPTADTPLPTRLASVSQDIRGFQRLVDALGSERNPGEVRDHLLASNAELAHLASALAGLSQDSEQRSHDSLTRLDGHLRWSLALLAAAISLVGAMAAALTVWTRRAVARPLGEVAIAMRRFHAAPAESDFTPVVVAPAPGSATTVDEVAQIVAGFNELVASVRHREHELDSSARQLRESNDALQQEIRERRAAESELLSSRELLDMSQSAGGIGVFDLDLGTRLMRGSGPFFTLQGIDPKTVSITQDQWLALVHPDDIEILISAFSAAVEAEGAYRAEYRIRRLDRAVRWVTSAGRVVIDHPLGLRRIIGSLMDVTERKLAELALRETEARLARAVRGTSDGLFEHNLTSDQVWFAPRVAELLGYRAADFPRSTAAFRALIHPEDDAAVETATRTHVDFGVPLDVEYRIRDARGAWQWLRTRAQVARDETTDSLILSGSLQLVTDRRAQAAELERARAAAEQANLAKTQFLANMSHEIRTPINGVIGMTHVLLDSALAGAQRECVEIIRSSGESLLGLVNDILDVAKVESGRLELEDIEFDVRMLVDEALGSVALTAMSKDLDIAAEVAVDVPLMVLGDPGRIRQCLVNLLSNAVKFTAHGHVATEVKRLADERDVVLRFTVSDTGIGIPADRLDRLFNEFTQVDSSTTRHFGGTGLGLTIVRRLATLMGGEAGVTSEAGRGSQFWFTARLAEAAKAAPAPAPMRARVLVLDPQPIAAHTLGRLIAEFGAEVEVICDQDAALRAVDHALASGQWPDVVMVDHRLLDDTIGAALGAARRAPSSPRIVLLTPLGSVPVAPPSGADALLSKPVRREVLSSCLRALLSTGPAATPLHADGHLAADGSRRVLLVEDNAVNRRVAEHQLNKLGCVVTVATNGLEAVELAQGAAWDVILMDCQMPLLDGFDATRRIREREPAGRRVPIIALTANALSGDRDACLTAGMDDYLTKPLDPAELAACLQRWAPVRALATMPAAGARAASHSAAPIDLDALRETTDGDAKFERELLDVFVQSGDAAITALLAALGRNDLPTVRRQAHALKGASASLRARGLAARAEALESAAAVGDLGRCTEAAANLERDYLDTARFIAARRA